VKTTTSKLRNKSVLVSGGAGFIGSHLVERIISENPKEVIVIDNFFLGSLANLDWAASQCPDLKVIRVDASNLAAVQETIKKNQVEVVFDLATIPLPTSLEFPNWTLTSIVAMAANMCEVARLGLIESLVHLSSSEAYGSAKYVPMDERHPNMASTPYAAGKASADLIVESYMKTFGIDATIIRPFNNFGPRQNQGSYAGIIPIVINNVLNGKPIEILGDGTQTRDFIFVSHTAELVVRLFDEKISHGDIWNLGSGIETSINDLVNRILKVMGKEDHKINYLPERPGDVKRHCADTKKLNRQ
jgi:UDP-glucose 4-epimerase